MAIQPDLLYYRGRVALSELLISANIGKEDCVAIQAYTCSAVPEGVMASGANPVYIDTIDKGITMSPTDLEQKLLNNSSIKAVVVQHTFGIAADITKIAKIAEVYNLVIIEDCCHTFSSEFNGIKVGSISDASFYSFEWGKPLSLGLGGGIKVNNPNMLKKLHSQYSCFTDPSIRSEFQLMLQKIGYHIFYNPRTYWLVKKIFHLLSNVGIIKGNHVDTDLIEISREFGWKMSKLSKFFLEKKLHKLEDIELRSHYVSDIYKQVLPDFCILQDTHKNYKSKSVLVRFPIWVEDKEETINKASKASIEIAEWYSTAVHPYKNKSLDSVNYQIGSCPNAEAACDHVVSLPLNFIPSKNYIAKLKKIII